MEATTAAVGDKVTAPRWPRRMFRGRPVTVTGAVVAATPDIIELKTPGGYYAVRADQARSAS